MSAFFFKSCIDQEELADPDYNIQCGRRCVDRKQQHRIGKTGGQSCKRPWIFESFGAIKERRITPSRTLPDTQRKKLLKWMLLNSNRTYSIYTLDFYLF